MTIEKLQVVIDLHYDEKYLSHNTAQVVMVIDTKDKDKVVYVGVLTRASLSEWFFGKGQAYAAEQYDVLVANICIAGKVIGVTRDRFDENDKSTEGETNNVKTKNTTKYVN